jgi:hypothetical protein
MAQARGASPSYQEPNKNVSHHPYPVMLPASKARAGIMDPDTLYMLIAGTTLTILLFAALFAHYNPA